MAGDGKVDAKGDELPRLTKRSSSVNLAKLDRFHHPSYDSSPLASIGFWPIAQHMIFEGLRHQIRSHEVMYHAGNPSKGPGTLAVCWHTAGLIDPMLVISAIDKRYVFAGRHDLLTGPIMGWWGRRMGVQPLLRQAERQRGHVDDETATRINSASMLTVACKLAYGQASIFLPEGHSHNESHLIRLRTGPMRSALNAAAVAREIGQPAPVIVPIGLTFRDPYQWRGDVLVDVGASIEVPKLADEQHGSRLLAGEWSEPDSETTLALRDEVRDRMAPLTPDAPDHATWQSWLVLAHLQAKSEGRWLPKWSEEVLSARRIRDHLRGSGKGVWAGPEAEQREDPASTLEIVTKGKQLASRLISQNLDGRELNHKRKSQLVKSSLALIPLLLILPFTLPIAIVGNGLHYAIGQTIARINDEAIDKRTTFHAMPTVIGSSTTRPVLLALAIAVLWFTGYITDPVFLIPAYVVLWLAVFPALYLVRATHNSLSDFRRLLRLLRVQKSTIWSEVCALEDSIIPLLGALK